MSDLSRFSSSGNGNLLAILQKSASDPPMYRLNAYTDKEVCCVNHEVQCWYYISLASDHIRVTCKLKTGFCDQKESLLAEILTIKIKCYVIFGGRCSLVHSECRLLLDQCHLPVRLSVGDKSGALRKRWEIGLLDLTTYTILSLFSLHAEPAPHLLSP